MKYNLEKIPSVQASASISDEFEFNLFDCLQSKEFKGQIDSVCLIIGFQKTSEGLKYVVIPNSIVDEDVEVKFVDAEHIEENFFVLESRGGGIKLRPDRGILKTPNVGDKVMCVAKGRYAGIQFGNIKKVLGMPEGRVKVWDNHNATYEDIYFVVVENSEYASGMTINSSGSTTVTDTAGSMRRSLIDPEIKKRTVIQTDKLILRKKEVDTEAIQKKRILSTTRIIKRIK